MRTLYQQFATLSESFHEAEVTLGKRKVQAAAATDALDRDRQRAAVRRLTDVVAEAAGDAGLADRTWVILTEAYDAGWGIAGHANTNEEIFALARAELSR